MRIGKRKYILTGIGAIVLCALLLAGLFGPPIVLDGKIVSYTKRLYENKGLRLTIDHYELQGWTNLHMTGIQISDCNSDSLQLFRLDTLHIRIPLLDLLGGQLKPSDVYANGMYIDMTSQNDSLTWQKYQNTDVYASEPDEKVNTPISFKILNTLKTVFGNIPKQFLVRKVSVDASTKGKTQTIKMKSARLLEQKLTVHLLINGRKAKLKGKLQPENYICNLTFETQNDSFLPLHYLYSKFGLKAGVQKLHFSINKATHGDNSVLQGSLSAESMRLHHRHLDVDVVRLEEASLDFRLNMTENTIELDTQSIASVNNLLFYPYIKYTQAEDTTLDIRMYTDTIQAQALFAALPTGMFENLKGIKVVGKLKYDMDFSYNSSMPDSLVFHSSLQQFRFGILGYGKTYLPKIKDSFVFTTWRTHRKKYIGYPAPNFIDLGNISPLLINTIQISEDPRFFFHRGFYEFAFADAIAQNLKSGRFKRGGSTITMQLVKNIYLTPHKTIGRKLEEILIVWLLENKRLVSKARMYEVYLNVIEWGNDVYGASEASKYFFKKSAAFMSLEESIFLSMIIPRPRKFKWFFRRDNGQLKDLCKKYYNLIARKLLKRDMITQEQFDAIDISKVKLTGKAVEELHWYQAQKRRQQGTK